MTSIFRSSMLLSTAKAATRTLTARQSYASISRRTISSTRFLSQEQQSTAPPLPTPETTPFTTENAPQETNLRTYPYTLKTGTVTSVGLMHKTVRVAYHHRSWDRHIRKTYPKTTTYLVADPRDSLREGDVIEFSSGAPRSRHVRHVVERIIAPFGEEISARPAVMTREEREAEKMAKRGEKLARKAARLAEAASAEGQQDVEAVTRGFLQSKDHIGRIRALVLERTAASS
jgi:ribosomal protein S17